MSVAYPAGSVDRVGAPSRRHHTLRPPIPADGYHSDMTTLCPDHCTLLFIMLHPTYLLAVRGGVRGGPLAQAPPGVHLLPPSVVRGFWLPCGVRMGLGVGAPEEAALAGV